MKPEDRYHRFVQWSDEDQCYIGYCPDLYFGGVCHADVELEAYRELCTTIREEVAHRLARAHQVEVPGAVGGVAEAFRNVGVAYSTGRGVKRDYAEAYGWLLLAKKHATAGTVADELHAFLTQLRRPELIAAGERRAPALERELAQTSVAKALPLPAPLVFTAPPADPAPAATADAPAGEPPVKLLAPSGRLLRWPSLAALRRAAECRLSRGARLRSLRRRGRRLDYPDISCWLYPLCDFDGAVHGLYRLVVDTQSVKSSCCRSTFDLS